MNIIKITMVILVIITLVGCNSKENLLNESSIYPENILETVSISSNKEIIIYNDVDTEGISTAFLAMGATDLGNQIVKTGSILNTNLDTEVSYHVTNHKWNDNTNTSIIYGLINDPKITKLIISDLNKQNFIELFPQIKEKGERKLWYATLDKPFTVFNLGIKAYNAEGKLIYHFSP